MRFGERLLNSAERKIGGLAMPGILKWIVGIQFLGMCFVMLSEGEVMNGLLFDRSKIMAGEVWRLFTWVFLPSFTSFLYLIWVFFMFFISNVIEEHLGSFRTTVLVVTTIVCFALAGMLPFPEGYLTPFHLQMPWTFTLLFVLIAAILVPEHVIYLWMILPVKMKWIGILNLALILMVVFQSPNAFITGAAMIVAFIPFFLGIVPPVLANAKQSGQAAIRRGKFERDAKINDNSAFHTCKNCGITDSKDPTMEFRVSSDDGEEYCLPCRERKRA